MPGYLVLRFALIAPMLAAGCASDHRPAAQCISDDDCSPSFGCIDNVCVAAPPFAMDAGSPFVTPYDASTGTRDTGTTLPDATPMEVIDGGTTGDGSVPDLDAGDECGAAACPAQNAECGPVLDTCGTEVVCGACGAGFACQTDNRCCVVPICPSDSCGLISNACSEVNCGGCSTGEQCGNDNRCRPVPAGCTTQPDETAWLTFRDSRTVSVVNGNAGWMDLGRATQLDGTGAHVDFLGPRGACSGSTTFRSTLLRLFDADLNVPADAVITGVRVQLNVKTSGAKPNLRTMHLWGPRANATPVTSSPIPSVGQPFPAGPTYQMLSYGAQRYGWGLDPTVLTPALVNHEWFSLRLGLNNTLACGAPNSTTDVDGAQVKVFYEVCR